MTEEMYEQIKEAAFNDELEKVAADPFSLLMLLGGAAKNLPKLYTMGGEMTRDVAKHMLSKKILNKKALIPLTLGAAGLGAIATTKN